MSDPDDIEAAVREQTFQGAWMIDPVVFGDYPPLMKERIAEKSQLQGYRQSRLPAFTKEQKMKLKGKQWLEITKRGDKEYGNINIHLMKVTLQPFFIQENKRKTCLG